MGDRHGSLAKGRLVVGFGRGEASGGSRREWRFFWLAGTDSATDSGKNVLGEAFAEAGHEGSDQEQGRRGGVGPGSDVKIHDAKREHEINDKREKEARDGAGHPRDEDHP